MSASTRWLGIIGGVIGVTIVAGILVALLTNRERTFEAGTPEHAVQQYLRAVQDQDASAALEWLSADLVERCDTFPRDAITMRGTNSFRATLEETVLRDNGTADVHVELTETYGDPPFGGGESTWAVLFELVNEDGTWRFAEAPWPLYCNPPVPAR